MRREEREPDAERRVCEERIWALPISIRYGQQARSLRPWCRLILLKKEKASPVKARRRS